MRSKEEIWESIREKERTGEVLNEDEVMEVLISIDKELHRKLQTLTKIGGVFVTSHIGRFLNKDDMSNTEFLQRMENLEGTNSISLLTLIRDMAYLFFTTKLLHIKGQDLSFLLKPRKEPDNESK